MSSTRCFTSSGSGAISAFLDCSFLTHSLFPNQRTGSGILALASLVASGETLYAASSLYLEFLSLLRKGMNQRRFSDAEARLVLRDVLDVRLSWVPETPQVCLRAFELAQRLNQSDIFDCAGYVIAQSLGADFVTSDRRFAKAARTANLPGVRFIA